MKGSRMMFGNGGKPRAGFAGAFVEGLVVDAVFAYARMENARLTPGRGAKHETEWLIYTEVLSRFLGVAVTELRDKLIQERRTCRDLRLWSDRIFSWASSNAHPW
jgi:hypothetical protein